MKMTWIQILVRPSRRNRILLRLSQKTDSRKMNRIKAYKIHSKFFSSLNYQNHIFYNLIEAKKFQGIKTARTLRSDFF